MSLRTRRNPLLLAATVALILTLPGSLDLTAEFAPVFSEDFDGQSPGEQPSGFDIVRPLSPAGMEEPFPVPEGSAGVIVVDSESNPVTAIAGRSARFYDYGQFTHLSRNFSFDPDSELEVVRIDFIFRRSVAIESGSPMWVALGEFDNHLNAAANQILRLNLWNDGRFAVRDGSSGHYLADEVNSVTIVAQTTASSLSYVSPDGQSRSLPSGTADVYLNGQRIGDAVPLLPDKKLQSFGFASSSAASGIDFVIDDLVISKPRPPRETLSIERLPGGEIELGWFARANRDYQVEVSADLKAWKPLGNAILGRASDVTFREQAGEYRRRFYRLTSRPAVLVGPDDDLVAAVAAAQPGETVVLTDGEWNNRQLTLRPNGGDGNPVRIRAETSGEVLFTGNSSLTIDGTHAVVEGLHFRDGYLESGGVIRLIGEHLRLTGTVIDAYNPPDRETRYFWVTLNGRHHEVDHCTFRGMLHNGVTLIVVRNDPSPDYHYIHRNYFLDRPRGTNSEWETVRIGTSHESLSSSFTTVERNLFEECDGEAEIISNKAGGNVYRYNTFYRSSGTLSLRHGDGCLVDSNFFLGEGAFGTGGIRVMGKDHIIINNYIERTRGRSGAAIALVAGIPDSPLTGYFAADNAMVAFNTIVAADGPYIDFSNGLGEDGRSILPANVTLANNILDGSLASSERVSPSGELFVGEHGPDLFAEGNIAYGRDLGAAAPEQGVREENPLLEIADDELWRPSPSSPAIASASGDYSFVTHDIDGQAREPVKDVGCDQLSSDPVTNRPLTPADVGASWFRFHFNTE